jgi:hypothetical protein
VTAVSTVFISLFTIVLALVTNRQARLTAQSVSIAERALVDLERPWIFIAGVTPRITVGPDKSVIPFIEYQIQNQGRAPAIIKSRRTGMILVENIPNAPPFERTDQVEEWLVLKASGDYPLTQRCNDKVNIDTYGEIQSGAITCVFFGVIEYEGTARTQYTTRFGYIHEPRQARGGESFENDRFIVCNKNAYNQYT